MNIGVLDATTSPVKNRPAIKVMPAGPAALLVEHAAKRFKVNRRKPPVLAVEDVSIRLERGETYGLL